MFKGGRKLLISVICCVVIIGLFCVVGFNRGFKINGVSVNYNTLDEETIKAEILKKDSENNIFKDDNNLGLNDFVVVDYVGLDKLVNRGILNYFLDSVICNSYTLPKEVMINYDGLIDFFDSYNKDATKSINAKIKHDNDKYYIKEEVYGNEIDIERLFGDLQSGKTGLDIKDYYVKPTKTKEMLESKVDELNKYVNWSVTYTNGKEVKAGVSCVRLDKKGSIKLDTKWLLPKVREVISNYNTFGRTRKFKTHTGKVIKVSGGTWGSETDSVSETKYLIKKFKKGKLVTNRKPCMLREYEDFGNTYVEVSISEQHIYVYKNGKLKMDSGIVTGDTVKGHDTPKGSYFISECINGKYLVGDDYKTWVNKWMRLTNMGIGLHDATWRSNFGGAIFRGNGSHGCINLPMSFASQLFEMSYVGMPVIIY